MTKKKTKKLLFPPTETKFGVIQREVERLGLPSHSHNKKLEIALKEHVGEEHTSAGVARLNVAVTESIVGVDAKIEMNLSAIDHKRQDINKHVPIESMIGNVNATAKAGFGLSGIGANAGITANAIITDIGPVTANVGIGTTTGAFVSPTQVSLHVLGTGVSLGEKTGISFMGSGVVVDIGKAVEEVGNHFVHHDPHAVVKEKVEKAESTVSVAFGLDVAKEKLVHNVIHPLENEITYELEKLTTIEN
eukprot:TRINITY_DN1408_c1_g3_i4.p1 TRINITY_DN1408_c1_g3~~TRINITY_DN1408_c1_g3_i4.p1  ORF type:complete len:248 (-),score=52.97 TRINITY_DN1408_c1_g3_i4:57-800(-)